MNPMDLVTVRDTLPEDRLEWGTLQWLSNAKLQPGAEQTLGLCTILPGQGNPLHCHPNCEEVLHVLAGVGRHRVEEEWVDLRPGVTIRIPKGVRHNLVNQGTEPMLCVIAFSSGDRQTMFLE
jgi:quercetin dioxygenase-like cupin family protein